MPGEQVDAGEGWVEYLFGEGLRWRDTGIDKVGNGRVHHELTLCPYQSAANPGDLRLLRASGDVCIVIPTAGGKSSWPPSSKAGACFKAWPEQRILIVTHVRELIEQNHAELKRSPGLGAPAGIYSAGLKQRDIAAQVLFAGIQSIHAG